MNIAAWTYQSARVWPRRPALYSGAHLHCDYAGLVQQICDRAAQFRQLGIQPGQRVAIFAKNAPEYLVAMQAIWWIGAVAVPINHKLHPKEAAWILENSGACLCLTDTGDTFASTALEAPPELALSAKVAAGAQVCPPVSVKGEELAWLFYTSGTTGRPKGAMLSHNNLAQMTLAYAMDVDQPRQGDHMLYAAPMSHGAGLYQFIQLRAGGAHVVPASQGFDCAEIRSLATALGGLVFFAAPTMVKRLVVEGRASGWDGTGLACIIYGGGPMYAADIEEALQVFGPRFVQIYGQGETPMTITALSREQIAQGGQGRRNSVGIAQGVTELEIRDPSGRALPAGQTGEICLRGPTVMMGYWQNPKATAEAIREGWLHSGDLGHLDEDGFLTLTDRSKDVIISGGTNIYPREVEDVLLRHPDIFEVAVIGQPDPEWGENVVAYVVLNSGAQFSEAALDSWMRAEIAAFKRPKSYHLLPQLPKNAYGKILKTQLRQLDSAKL